MSSDSAESMGSAPYAHQNVKVLHTLGPTGTNLETAGKAWMELREIAGSVVLHPSLELAMQVTPTTGEHALLACAVYPDLHVLTFKNLGRLTMVDSFIYPTHNMVLAARRPACRIYTVATHPAPGGLAPYTADQHIVLSNSQAALDCAAGRVDACITTNVAAKANDLVIIQDFGTVPMVFTVHLVEKIED